MTVQQGQGRGESVLSPRRMNAAQRQRDAVRLRIAGATFDDIAKQCGYKDRAAAFHAVKTALRKSLQEPADELRKLEVERLDRALLAIWGQVTSGNLKAVTTMLHLMRRRADLLGLDVPVAFGGGGDESALDALMRTLKDSHVDPTEYDA